MARTPTCHPARKHEARGLCAPCYVRQRLRTNPAARAKQNRREVARAQRRRRERPEVERARVLRLKYGITLEQYARMFLRQGGGCALCSVPPKTRALHVDHDHTTGRVRGLLCFRCNHLRVGPARDAEVTLYQRLVEYLASDFDGRKL